MKRKQHARSWTGASSLLTTDLLTRAGTVLCWLNLPLIHGCLQTLVQILEAVDLQRVLSEHFWVFKLFTCRFANTRVKTRNGFELNQSTRPAKKLRAPTPPGHQQMSGAEGATASPVGRMIWRCLLLCLALHLFPAEHYMVLAAFQLLIGLNPAPPAEQWGTNSQKSFSKVKFCRIFQMFWFVCWGNTLLNILKNISNTWEENYQKKHKTKQNDVCVGSQSSRS